MCKAAVERTRRESAVRNSVSHYAHRATSEATVELVQYSSSASIATTTTGLQGTEV